MQYATQVERTVTLTMDEETAKLLVDALAFYAARATVAINNKHWIPAALNLGVTIQNKIS